MTSLRQYKSHRSLTAPSDDSYSFVKSPVAAYLSSKPKRSTSSSRQRYFSKQTRTKTPAPQATIKLAQDVPASQVSSALIASHLSAAFGANSRPNTEKQRSLAEFPLTVFRDMFVMAIDVQSYRADSVRILKEGSTILIECLERTKDREASLIQTGVFNKDGTVKTDKIPALKQMPALSSCKYAYHRVALPENFAKHGLKYGYDDVSRHVVITGKLLPSPYNSNGNGGNKVKVVGKGPQVCNILWREKAKRMPTYHELWDMAHKKFEDEEQNQKGPRKQQSMVKFQNFTKSKSRLEIEGAIMKLAEKTEEQKKQVRTSKSCGAAVNVKGSRSSSAVKGVTTATKHKISSKASNPKNNVAKFQKDQNNPTQSSRGGSTTSAPTSKDIAKNKAPVHMKRSATAVSTTSTTSAVVDEENNVTQAAQVANKNLGNLPAQVLQSSGLKPETWQADLDPGLTKLNSKPSN